MANVPGLQGIDVHGSKGKVDWAVVKALGKAFAYVKASQGVDFFDVRYKLNTQGCRDNGIMVGPYHFFEWDRDAAMQADVFIHVIRGTWRPGDLPPMVDIEAPGDGATHNKKWPAGQTKAQRQAMTRIFVDRVSAATGVRCGIYTYPSLWKDGLGNPTSFASDTPLWIASYPKTPGPGLKPALVGGWTEYKFWQWGASGIVRDKDGRGVPGPCDVDAFPGTLADLQALCGVGAPPPPEPEPTTRFFEKTGHNVSHGFLEFFDDHGGLAIFGFPRTEAIQGTVGTWTGTVQYFERARFEWHPEIDGGTVLLGLLGSEKLAEHPELAG